MNHSSSLCRNVLVLLLFAGIAPRLQAQGLNVYLTFGSDVVAPGDRLVGTLVATNTGGADLTDVSADVQWPQGFPGPGVLGEDFRWTGSSYVGQAAIARGSQGKTESPPRVAISTNR